jgi:hypothetical protein
MPLARQGTFDPNVSLFSKYGYISIKMTAYHTKPLQNCPTLIYEQTEAHFDRSPIGHESLGTNPTFGD